jgi:hypothetical protein
VVLNDEEMVGCWSVLLKFAVTKTSIINLLDIVKINPKHSF